MENEIVDIQQFYLIFCACRAGDSYSLSKFRSDARHDPDSVRLVIVIYVVLQIFTLFK